MTRARCRRDRLLAVLVLLAVAAGSPACRRRAERASREFSDPHPLPAEPQVIEMMMNECIRAW